MRILGIETSCDETGVAVYDDAQGLLSHELYSQVKLHADYGGVVPELASRDHVRKIIPLVQKALADANTNSSELDGVAFTQGPGLVGALLVGSSVGRALSYAWNIPAVGVHHMEGHLVGSHVGSQCASISFYSAVGIGGALDAGQCTGHWTIRSVGRIY